MRGKPKTGGRKKGVRNKVTAEREAEIAASGLTPLEYMLGVLRDPNAHPLRRDDMAKAAAPYVHSKLATIAHTGPDGGPMQFRDFSALTDDELEQIIASGSKLDGENKLSFLSDLFGGANNAAQAQINAIEQGLGQATGDINQATRP